MPAANGLGFPYYCMALRPDLFQGFAVRNPARRYGNPAGFIAVNRGRPCGYVCCYLWRLCDAISYLVNIKAVESKPRRIQ